MDRSNLFYDFGRWGYHTNATEGQILPGFAPDPPGEEICGQYDIVFAAALRFNSSTQNADMLLRRTTAGHVTIAQRSRPFSVWIGRRHHQRSIIGNTIHDGRIDLTNQYFGDGYNIFGFSADSEEAQSYQHKPANASLVVTHRNNNLGRLLVVSERKAFRLIETEQGVMRDPDIVYESQEHEAEEAERICNSRHFSCLCQDLGLPCHVATLITRYADDKPAYFFAEPGDIWIDIRLTTPVRTYVLARRSKESATTGAW